MTSRGQVVTKSSSKSQARVFISSTVADLSEHRAAAIEACLRVGVTPIVMKVFLEPANATL